MKRLLCVLISIILMIANPLSAWADSENTINKFSNSLFFVDSDKKTIQERVFVPEARTLSGEKQTYDTNVATAQMDIASSSGNQTIDFETQDENALFDEEENSSNDLIDNNQIPALTDSEAALAEYRDSFSFVDAEGKSNEARVLVSEDGAVLIEYYIDDVLVNTAEATVDSFNVEQTSELGIQFTDVLNDEVEYYTYDSDDYSQLTSLTDLEISFSDSFSFVDAEGKPNETRLFIYEDGSILVEYYISGILVNTAETTSSLNNRDRATEIEIKYTDVQNDNVKYYSYDLNSYIESNELNSSKEINLRGDWYYNGYITYNTVYTGWGINYDCALVMYQKYDGYVIGTKSVNVQAQIAASVVIAILALALSQFCPPLAALTETLFGKIIYEAGVLIIDGLISSALDVTYSMIAYNYSIAAHAWENSSYLNYHLYSGRSCYLRYPDGTYSTCPIYDGYLGWAIPYVSYYLFCDAWSYQYPGVSDCQPVHW